MKEKIKKQWPKIKIGLQVFVSFFMVVASNYYLQLTQNNLSWDLATKFAFSWHTEKFILGCLVLAILLLFLMSLIGSWSVGLLFFTVLIGLLGFANYQKMYYRVEPIYPDDLKMITELSLMKEMIGTWPFVICLLVIGVALGFLCYAFYRSLFLSRKKQMVRLSLLGVSLLSLFYVGQFNQPTNLLRKAYNKTALWIPYSQKMNYYNTGFMGGFLYNLHVEPMAKPAGYSAEKVKEVVAKYQTDTTVTATEKPNIVYIMSESFSDPLRLKGIQSDADPLQAYKEIANQTYSGQLLSQNYGGGTANIEFEALTGLSMELFNSQLTTPYTMLVPNLAELPSLVSLTKERGYQTTAIHPYNTSMYKRKDVYNVLGFDQFLDESTMTHQEKVENNPYISDQAAFTEVLDVLEADSPQFVHLVTMQTHMPYKDKYEPSGHQLSGVDNPQTIDNYMTDVKYTSEALAAFLGELKKLPQRTLVVFWGDHLPSIYSDDFQAANSDVDMHLTEFLFWDSQGKLKETTASANMSPIYFGPKLFELSGVSGTGFYQLLTELEAVLPAFEKNFYYSAGQWQKTLALSGKDKQLYEDYQMIQYDIVAGKQYSAKADFFKE